MCNDPYVWTSVKLLQKWSLKVIQTSKILKDQQFKKWICKQSNLNLYKRWWSQRKQNLVSSQQELCHPGKYILLPVEFLSSVGRMCRQLLLMLVSSVKWNAIEDDYYTKVESLRRCARSVALLPEAGRPRLTVRRRGSEHPCYWEQQWFYKLFQEPSHSKVNRTSSGRGKVTGKLNLVILPSWMEDWIESYPLIVSGLSHRGKASVPTSKILLSQHKVKKDLLFGCFSRKLLTTGSPRDHWVGDWVWCSQ